MKVLGILMLFVSSVSFAWDSGKCSGMLNDGFYKKYSWAGVGESQQKALTGETKKSGTTKGSTRISTDNSTAALDPKYSSNASTSGTQGTSSFGQCSLFALQTRQEEREAYVSQNFDLIRKDVANGAGGNLEALSWLSLCDDGTSQSFNSLLQKKYSEIFSNSDVKQVGKRIDAIIAGSPELAGKCYNLSSL